MIIAVFPGIRIVAVQVGAAAIFTSPIRAIVVIRVLSPHPAGVGFILQASIGVGRKHQVHAVVIQQPFHIGIGFVIGEKVLCQAQIQFRRSPFAGVDAAHEEGVRFRD